MGYNTLANFRIEKKIGRGQFSEVYRAACLLDGVHVALKKVQVRWPRSCRSVTPRRVRARRGEARPRWRGLGRVTRAFWEGGMLSLEPARGLAGETRFRLVLLQLLPVGSHLRWLRPPGPGSDGRAGKHGERAHAVSRSPPRLDQGRRNQGEPGGSGGRVRPETMGSGAPSQGCVAGGGLSRSLRAEPVSLRSELWGSTRRASCACDRRETQHWSPVGGEGDREKN